VSLMRRVHSASSSLRERRIGTDKRPAVCSACRNVEWLLSDEHSSVVTGATWPIFAGWSSRNLPLERNYWQID
jgi:hypothetical protein